MKRGLGPKLGLGLLLAAHVAYYFPRVVDDLFISLRYAENLARGEGAVYNHGERVEGYSSPAWMLLQTLGFLLGLEPITFTKVLGIGCLVAAAFGTRALARELYGVDSWPSWIPAYACALSSYLVDWAVLGLETPFHVAAIVLAPLAIARALAAPSRRRLTIATLALIALGMSRPESILYVVVNVAAPLAGARTRAELGGIVRRTLPIALGAALVLGALLALRFGYYGELVPNTYHVKGAHASFALAKLAPLWQQGCAPLEAAVTWTGLAAIVAYSARRRAVAPALSAIVCLYFTAKVAPDWMPNLRHLLPVLVLAPVGWACVVADLREARARPQSAIAVALLTFAGLTIASVDVRYSTIEHRGPWLARKSLAHWKDTVFAYRRIEPPHVTRMNPDEMGQVSQAWAVLETSAEPIERSWYAGRDIGAVGFGTGVLVFDTAGLVTREVARDEAWSARGEISDELVRALLAKRPLAADVFDGWDRAVGRNGALLSGFRVTRGVPQEPKRLVAIDRPAPTRTEVLRRYRALLARLPRLYHLHTLYGEAMGAAVERRLRIIEAMPTAP